MVIVALSTVYTTEIFRSPTMTLLNETGPIIDLEFFLDKAHYQDHFDSNGYF